LTSIILESPPRLAAAAAEGRTGSRPDALGGGSWRRAARRPRRPASGAVTAVAGYLISALVLCVCLARLDCLLSHPPCLTAHGERTWLTWAYRHPEPQDLWRRIAGQLRPGEPVVIVARQAVAETYWWRTMAGYFLPGHPIAATRNVAARRSEPVAGAAEVIVSADGREVRVRRVAA
jgi:hypothetical protein